MMKNLKPALGVEVLGVTVGFFGCAAENQNTPESGGAAVEVSGTVREGYGC